jgi:hypothetical protein
MGRVLISISLLHQFCPTLTSPKLVLLCHLLFCLARVPFQLIRDLFSRLLPFPLQVSLPNLIFFRACQHIHHHQFLLKGPLCLASLPPQYYAAPLAAKPNKLVKSKYRNKNTVSKIVELFTKNAALKAQLQSLKSPVPSLAPLPLGCGFWYYPSPTTLSSPNPSQSPSSLVVHDSLL